MDCSCQPPLSLGFSGQEYWSGLPCPPSSRVSSQPRERTHDSCVSCPAGGFFTTEPLEKPLTPAYVSLIFFKAIWKTPLKNQWRVHKCVTYQTTIVSAAERVGFIFLTHETQNCFPALKGFFPTVRVNLPFGFYLRTYLSARAGDGWGSCALEEGQPSTEGKLMINVYLDSMGHPYHLLLLVIEATCNEILRIRGKVTICSCKHIILFWGQQICMGWNYSSVHLLPIIARQW